MIEQFIDLFLHLDKHLADIVSQYGTLTYLILFVIIFAETGLVVTPFLPGDSLLFATGATIAVSNGSLNLGLMLLILFIAAVLGDTVNYFVGKFLGQRVFEMNSRWIKREYLERTHAFYEKHGGKTIVYARFIPIIRTFAPFVAGVGAMNYPRFIVYNLLGGAVWVSAFLLAGYFFAENEIVKKNFSLVVLGIIFVSLLPPLIEYLRHRFSKKPAAQS
ncbi:MAG: DedA family protein [Bacteroidia bacterium]|nr:DedA family protein [Bacteroidia bacterium]